MAKHGTIGVVGSSPPGTTGPSAESTSPRVDGSITSASHGIAPATFEPRLGAKLNNATDRREAIHTLTTAKRRPRANPETGPAQSTQDDQEPLAIFLAFVYTQTSTSGFLSFLNRKPINIETKTQRQAAQLTVVEAELMTAISFEGKNSTYLSNFNMKFIL